MDTGMGMDTGGGKDGGGSCGDAGNGMMCRACCVNAHMMGAQVLANATHTCVCTGNKCPSCAGNYCDGGQPMGQCNACGLATLNPDGGACFGPVSSACTNSADCQAYFACLATCP
jgi:hypothetical protein